jgi:hypothetical protein
MSGQTFEVGSIISFTPIQDEWAVKLWRGEWEGEYLDAPRMFGWVLVVVDRDGWSVTSEMQPAVHCCGRLVPVYHHWNSRHPDWDSTTSQSGEWTGQVTRSIEDAKAIRHGKQPHG